MVLLKLVKLSERVICLKDCLIALSQVTNSLENACVGYEVKKGGKVFEKASLRKSFELLLNMMIPTWCSQVAPFFV
jgi:hypothetical protein